MAEFYSFLNTNAMCTQSIFFTEQPGVGVGDSEGQPGHSFHTGLVFFRGDFLSNPITERLVAQQQHFKLLDLVDQGHPKATGQHVLCVLLAPISNVGHQDMAFESSAHPTLISS